MCAIRNGTSNKKSAYAGKKGVAYATGPGDVAILERKKRGTKMSNVRKDGNERFSHTTKKSTTTVCRPPNVETQETKMALTPPQSPRQKKMRAGAPICCRQWPRLGRERFSILHAVESGQNYPNHEPKLESRLSGKGRAERHNSLCAKGGNAPGADQKKIVKRITDNPHGSATGGLH